MLCRAVAGEMAILRQLRQETGTVLLIRLSNRVCNVIGTQKSSFVRLSWSSSCWRVSLPYSSLSSGERKPNWARFYPLTFPMRCFTIAMTGVRDEAFRSSCNVRHSNRGRGDGDGVCCLIDAYSFQKHHS